MAEGYYKEPGSGQHLEGTLGEKGCFHCRAVLHAGLQVCQHCILQRTPRARCRRPPAQLLHQQNRLRTHDIPAVWGCLQSGMSGNRHLLLPQLCPGSASVLGVGRGRPPLWCCCQHCRQRPIDTLLLRGRLKQDVPT